MRFVAGLAADFAAVFAGVILPLPRLGVSEAILPQLGLTGGGAFISQPLAIVVIGGLVSSTLLTLVLVPTLYTMVENRREKSRAKREQRRLHKAGAEAPKHAADEPEAVLA